MNSPRFSISIVTAGVITFTVLCNSGLDIPTGFLIAFLLLLHGGMIWMLITILRKEKNSEHTLEKRFNDSDY